MLLDELDAGDAQDRAVATVLRIRNDPQGPLRRAHRGARCRRGGAGAVGDTLGLVRCENARAWVYWGACRAHDSHLAYLRAYALLQRGDRAILAHDVIFGACVTGIFGGLTADELMQLFDELEPAPRRPGRLLAATLRSFRARVGYGAGQDRRRRVGGRSRRRARAPRADGLGVRRRRSPVRARRRSVSSPETAQRSSGAWRVRTKETQTARHAAVPRERAGGVGGLAVPARQTARPLEVVAEAREVADPNDIADQTELDLAEAYAHALAGEREALVARRARPAQP